jgi:diketogulonate reductase-like aldo/keto reductase
MPAHLAAGCIDPTPAGRQTGVVPQSTAIATRPFGSTGVQVPWLGQGTWQIEDASRVTAIAALRRGFDLGMVHVDTAEMYGAGTAEEILAEAMAGRRDELFVVSKVLPHNATRAGTIAACERSLARLRTDRLDCYLLHWPSQHPLEETVRAFAQLEQDGKIRSFGVSNFHASDIERAVALAGAGKIACNQVRYHLDDRGSEKVDLPLCERHGIALVGYSPFGSRFPGPRTAGGRVLAEVAAAHGATPRQVALCFLARRAALFAIPKAATVAHVEENAGAGKLVLSDADLRRIDRAFPVGAAPAARLSR